MGMCFLNLSLDLEYGGASEECEWAASLQATSSQLAIL